MGIFHEDFEWGFRMGIDLMMEKKQMTLRRHWNDGNRAEPFQGW